jgi:hypothetical protein
VGIARVVKRLEARMSQNREKLLRELKVENRRNTAESMFLLQAITERDEPDRPAVH